MVIIILQQQQQLRLGIAKGDVGFALYFKNIFLLQAP